MSEAADEILRCDRCKKLKPGLIADGVSAGFYIVADAGDQNYWAKFARKGESLICDQCMWNDPKYQEEYGGFKA